MSVVVTDNGGDPPEVPAAIAKDVGHLEATTEHHAAAIAEHEDKLEAIEGDTAWLKTRLAEMESAMIEAPASAIADLRAQVTALQHELTARTAALSEAIVTETTEDPQTDPPPPQANEAEENDPPAGPLGGLRKALHRLL